MPERDGMLSRTPAVLLLTFLCIQVGWSFPSGAPYSTCVHLHPHHGASAAQQGAPPITVRTNVSTYAPEGAVQVTVTGTQAFKGFVVVASRVEGDTEEIIGNFSNIPDFAFGLTWPPLKSGYINCLTHKNASDRRGSINVTWRAGANSYGKIMFRVSVAVNFTTFWVNVTSAPVSASSPASNPPFPSISRPEFAPISCDDDEGCFQNPENCLSSEDCEQLVTFKKSATVPGVQFELYGKSSDYIAVGLSDDKRMGDDLTVTCVATDFGSNIQLGVNPDYYNAPIRRVGLSAMEISRRDGRLTCRFVVPIKQSALLFKLSGDFGVKEFNLKRDFHILLVKGSAYEGSNDIMKHSETMVSEQKMSLLMPQHKIPGSAAANLKAGYSRQLILISLACFTTIRLI